MLWSIFSLIKGPQKPNLLPNFFLVFLRILYNLQEAGKTRENLKYFEKKVSVSEKKSFSSDTNTEIGPQFWFPIPKPDFGGKLDQCPHIFVTYALFFYTSFKTILDPFKNSWIGPKLFGSIEKCSYYVHKVLDKVVQQFHILLFIDNSIANISLHALSRPQ